MFYSFLFPRYANDRITSLMILFFRLLLGVIFMLHGFDKLNNFTALSTTFIDPLGIGSRLSLLLTLMAELVCAAFFICGFLYRLALIPMIITMLVAFIIVHHGSLTDGEPAFLFLASFIILFGMGAGRYSVDYWIDNSIEQRRSEVGMQYDDDTL